MDQGGIAIKDKDPIRASCPHHALIRFTIEVVKRNTDGTLDTTPVSGKTFKKYGISNTAEFTLDGFNEADCLRQIKETLESLNG